jgi:tetratricopeptide (TPR) repeat protein
MREFKVNNFGAAVDTLAAAVRLDPTKPQYHYYYGLCLLRITQRRDEAEGAFKKALELDPTKVEHHLELGNYYVKSGQMAKGIGVLNNALMRHPDSPKLKDAIKAASGTVAESAAEEKTGGMFSKLFKKEK